MKPPPFTYHAPTTLAEATELLHGLDEALPLGGGQSLVPLLNLRLAHPRHLVDLSGVGELRSIEVSDITVTVGAGIRHRELETLAGELPLVAEAARHIGHPAIRNRGTLGGSLAHADPAAELPLVALVLDATIHLRSVAGSRSVPAGEFLVGHYTTARRADEVVTAVTFPRHRGPWGFAEFTRRTGDFALVAAAIVAEVDGGAVRSCRVGLGGVDGRPVRIEAAETLLAGRPLDRAAGEEAGAAVAETVQPVADVHGSAAYRRRLARVLVRDAVAAAGRSVTDA